MNASLELCRELYELSGWDDTEDKYWNGEVSSDIDNNVWDWGKNNYKKNCSPAYDLGYLLRKLQSEIDYDEVSLDLLYGTYTCRTTWNKKKNYSFGAETPEDATAKLAIELFKQGILTKGDK